MAKISIDNGIGFPASMVTRIYNHGGDELGRDISIENLIGLSNSATMACAMELAELNHREIEVLFLRYYMRASLEEIGSVLNVGRERVRQIEAKALRKMRARKASREVISNGIVGWVRNFEKTHIEEESAKLAQQMFEEWKTLYIQTHNVQPTPEEIEAKKMAEAKMQYDKLMATTIAEMNLSVRSHNCLTRAGYSTLGDIINKVKEFGISPLMAIRNLGHRSLDEVCQKVYDLSGFSIKDYNPSDIA